MTPNDPLATVRSDGSATPVALVCGAERAAVASLAGETRAGPARALLAETAGPVLVVHAPTMLRRIARSGAAAPADLWDVLELFAFSRPAQFCAPTPRGLAAAMDLGAPGDLEAEARAVLESARRLLSALADPNTPHGLRALGLARMMGEAGWPWASPVVAALSPAFGAGRAPAYGGLDIWTALPEWEERAPAGPPGSAPIGAKEAAERLVAFVAAKGDAAEARREQRAYAAALTPAFAPPEAADAPAIVLAEAGTGVGKTLGYLAPASLWAERNGPGLVVSTYTKALQRQLQRDLEEVIGAGAAPRLRAAVRKGRENYLCLLNYQEAVAQGARDRIWLGLVARWALASRDGDVASGDYPGWLNDVRRRYAGDGAGLMGAAAPAASAAALTDRRGECVYSVCPHYRKCFIERTVRAARRAHIVVANHALVLAQAAAEGAAGAAARADPAEGARRRYVFDEGHHLFAAADAAFARFLSGREMAELRRWVRGAEGARRARGLRERIGDLIGDDKAGEDALAQLVKAARALPADGWIVRCLNADGAPAPSGPAEAFLSAVADHVRARSRADSRLGAQEAAAEAVSPHLIERALTLSRAFGEIAAPLRALAACLADRLADEAETLETGERIRIEGAVRGMALRGADLIPAWRAMLAALGEGPDEASVDWFVIERTGAGAAADVGLRRHALNPALQLARTVLAPSGGAVITSATLRDAPARAASAADPEAAGRAEWASAEARLGVGVLKGRIAHVSVASPFDYPALSRVFIVNDLNRDDADQIAGAYRALFLAAGGGALGLFTAIRRLRAVYGRIAAPLEQAGAPLYAQHEDAMDVGALLDVFRIEENACLLGSDAVRDGVDVPGRALRLIVFDRVPWPRPDILHKARRAHFGAGYDDQIVRTRLKQAYGRLIRTATDRGVFVMLDRRTPTRLLTAFPPGVDVVRTGLAETVRGVRDFLSAPPPLPEAAAAPTVAASTLR